MVSRSERLRVSRRRGSIQPQRLQPLRKQEPQQEPQFEIVTEKVTKKRPLTSKEKLAFFIKQLKS